MTRRDEDAHNPDEALTVGSLNQTLDERDVVVTLHHLTSMALGSLRSGVLTLAPDDYGLRFQLRHPRLEAAVRAPGGVQITLTRPGADPTVTTLSAASACVIAHGTKEMQRGEGHGLIRRADLYELALIVGRPKAAGTRIEAVP